MDPSSIVVLNPLVTLFPEVKATGSGGTSSASQEQWVPAGGHGGDKASDATLERPTSAAGKSSALIKKPMSKVLAVRKPPIKKSTKYVIEYFSCLLAIWQLETKMLIVQDFFYSWLGRS